jgi:hypothetical protein
VRVPVGGARDLESILNQYTETTEVNEQAKDLLASRSLPPSELPRLRKLAAEQRSIRIGDEAVDYLLDQLVEILMHSSNVDEVFAEDFELRRLLREPLRSEDAEKRSSSPRYAAAQARQGGRRYW